MRKRIFVITFSIIFMLNFYIPTSFCVPVSAAGSEIESFTATLRAGGKMVGDKYTWVATNNNADHRFTYRINYATSGEEDRPAGTFEIRIPERLLKDRDGDYADYLDMSIPEENDPEITDETKFVYKVKDGDVIIYNRIPISAAENGYFEVSYITSKRTFEYKDMGASDEFNATFKLNDDGHILTDSATAPKVYIDTTAEISGTDKRNPNLYKTWNPSWGEDTKPENYDDYYYLVWEVRSRIKKPTQPYNFSLEDDFNTNADGSVVGYKMQGEKKYREDSLVKNLKMTNCDDPYEDRYDYVLTKHKKSTYQDLEYYEMKNYVTACVDPIDQIDDDTYAQSSKNWIYKKPKFTVPSGHFKLWKWGNDYNNWTVNDSEDIRDFSLSEFQNKKKDEIDNLRYHVEEIGYPYPWTLDGDPKDPENYGKKPVTYELTDDKVKINNNDTFLSDDEFEFEKLDFSYYIRDAEFNEETQIFDTRLPEYTDDHVIDFYAKKSDDYVKVAAYKLKSNTWSDINEDYVKSANGKSISFKPNVTGWKTKMTNAFYCTDFDVYPYIKIKRSELIEAETQVPKVEVHNTADNKMLDNEDKTIYTESLTGTDYIIGVEKDGHIQKTVLNYKNSKVHKAYNITWEGKVYEDYMNTSFKRVKTTQDSGIFYDLLPIGGVLNRDSIVVKGDDQIIPNGSFTYEVKENYKSSGRDLLVVKISEPAKEYKVSYKTTHSWDAIKDHGINVKNDIAYETGNDEIGDGLPDSGGGVNEFVDLDPNTNAEKFLYADKTHIIDIITAGNLGLRKKVKAQDDEDYVKETTTYPDSDYSYNIRFATDEETQAKNLIVFDSLENYHNDTVETEWHGTLKSVNTKQIEKLGVAPVVYYSTIPELNLAQHHDLDEVISGEKVWKTKDEMDDIEAAKAVAIDMRKNKDGDNFVLDYDTGVSIVLNMRSPHSSNALPGHENAAYNNIYLKDTLISSVGYETDEFIHQDYTKIKYRVVGNIDFDKVSSKDHNLKISGIKFRLTGTSDYGTEVSKETVSASDGKVSFKNVEKGSYQLQEVEGTDDWLEDHEMREVVIDGEGNVFINGQVNYVFENTPRIHTDVQFTKKNFKGINLDKTKNISVPGCIFMLSGTSDYGNNIVRFETSDLKGLVDFKNIEKGTYSLIETVPNNDYIKNPNIYTVVVDENGNMTIRNAENDEDEFIKNNNSSYYLFNEPYHDFSLRKRDATNNTQFLEGAEFKLTGTSDYGNKVEKTETSNDLGRVTFDYLEAGTYILQETKAPDKHHLDPTKRVVEIDKEGNVSIEGLSKEADTGFFIVDNERKIDGKITITKKWHDGLTGEEADNRPEPTVHISTSEPKEFNGYNVRFDANGGNFNNGDTINVLRTKPKTQEVEKDAIFYSHTPNVKDNGDQNGNYPNSANLNDVVTIPGAQSLHVKIVYGGEGASYDYVCAWEGNHPDYTAANNNSTSFTGKLGGGNHTNSSNTKEYDITGDTVTFGFRSDSGGTGDGYGYYAIVTSPGIERVTVQETINDIVEGSYKEPVYDSVNDRYFMGWAKKPKSSNYYEWGSEVINKDITLYAQWEPSEAYAVFDSSDGTLRFFRDKPKKYSNGQTDGTKTYYTGVENTGTNDPPWYSKRSSVTKVIFEDSIKPSSCNKWFCGMNNLTSFDDISKFDTSKVTNMYYMFQNCNAITSLDLSGFDTSNVTDMESMFSDCNALTSLDVSGFDTSKVTNMSYMFSGCNKLTNLDLSGFDTSNVTNMSLMFYYCQSLTSLGVSGFDTSKVTDMGSMFAYCNKLTNLDLSGFDTSNVTNMSLMFYYCQALTSLGVSGFDTSKVTDMNNMFSSCNALTSLDVSGFDTSKVTDMVAMFDGCYALINLDVSGFDTSNVTNMSSMFRGCYALTSLDVSGFDTSNVTDMAHMFRSCWKLTNLDVSGFDTSNVTDMRYMFDDCKALTSLDVSGFDTSKVKDMGHMFDNCNALTNLDMSGFNTSNVTDMSSMFYYCQALTNLDLSGFDTSNVTSMRYMFYDCNALTNIYASEKWNTDRVTSSDYMFSDCTSLPNFSSSYVDKTKAHYNEGGYLTYKPAPTMLMGLSTKRMIKQHSMKNIRLNSASDTATITFKSGSDGSFENGMDTNVVTYNLVNATVKKYSHTPNISDDGTQSGNYPDSANLNDVVTIPGAAKLHVKITYGGESANYDWACVWEGSHSGYTASSNYSSSVSGKLGGGNHTSASNTKEYDIIGDAVTFGFKSDSSGIGDGYGYYAVVTGLNEDGSELEPTTKVLGDVVEGEYKEPIPTDPEYRFKEWNPDISNLNEDATISATYEEDVIAKGTYDGVDWKIKSDGTLVIGKSGETQTFTYRDSRNSNSWPWYNYRSQIKSARFDGTVKGNGSHENMFSYCTALTSLDVSGFDTSNVTDMNGMFRGCDSLTSLDLSGFDTSKVTNMFGMFSGCESLTSLDMSGFDTSKVTNMNSMFSGCDSLTSLDVSEFDTSNVTSMWNMFDGCYALTSLDLSGFDTSNVTNMSDMFTGCDSFTSLDLSGFDTSNVTSMYEMFSGCSKLTSLDLSGFDTSKVTDMGRMFNGCRALTSLDVSNFDTSKVKSMYGMFSDCNALTSLDVSEFDTSKVTSMYEMFSGCSKLTSLDVSGFDTSNVTNMRNMFAGCKALTNLDVSGFDTSNVTNMYGMFSGCKALTSLDLSGFNTSKVTNMNNMFEGCKALTNLDVSGFDTSNVTNMIYMFCDCQALTNLDVLGFDTSNVTNMAYMFRGCKALTSLDVSGFDTSKVTSMDDMFEFCSALTNLDLSGFDTSNVTSMGWMFYGCNALTSLDVSGFDTSKVTNMSKMFYDCQALTSLALGEKTRLKNDTYAPSNWTRYAKLSGMRVYDQPVLSKLSDYDGTAPGWYKVNGTTAPNEADMNEEHISKQEDHADVEWTKVSDDTWTYTFNVYDDESDWYVYEEDYTGYNTDATITSYKTTENGKVTINNTPEGQEPPDDPDDPENPKPETGSLDITKKLAGDTTDEDQNKEFTFEIELSGMTGTKIIGDTVFKDGKATFYLKAEEHFKLDLPAGTTYKVTEKEDPGFESSNSGNTEGSIVKDDTKNVTFTNTKKVVPTNGFKVSKKVTGEFANPSDEFEFIAKFSGLEANAEYKIAEDITIKTNKTGSATLKFALKSGETQEFKNLPIGSKYQVTEFANAYSASYNITDTNNGHLTIEKNKAENNGTNKNLSTDEEKVDENERINITFTNTLDSVVPSGIDSVKKSLMIIFVVCILIALAGKKISTRNTRATIRKYSS